MSSLKSSIASLAETFASSVLAAIRSASLEEILSEGSGRRSPAPAPPKRGPGRPRKEASNVAKSKPVTAAKGGRLPRRSEEDLQKVVGLVVSALKSAPEGLRSEHLQRVLKISKKELVGPLNLALGQKKISKKGERRSTTYFAK
jgi:hypothetical protein